MRQDLGVDLANEPFESLLVEAIRVEHAFDSKVGAQADIEEVRRVVARFDGDRVLAWSTFAC